MRRPLSALAAVVLVWLVLAGWFWFVCDDAWISFRYARNLAHGHGLRFNVGEWPPVEGYSNFLWVLLLAGAELLRLPPQVVAPLLSLACGAALLVGVWRAAQDRLDVGAWAGLVGVLALALSPGFVVWGTGGLETMAFAALLFLLVDRWVLDDADGARAVAPAVGVALIRTEGVAWVLVVAALGLWARGGDRAPAAARAALVGACGRALALFGVYFAARYAWFGTWTSNTALVKLAFGAESARRGALYVLGYWLVAVAPALHLLSGPLAAAQVGRRGAALAALAVAFPAYAVVVGGDFMTMGRLLVPGLSFAALTTAVVVDRAARRGPALGAAAMVAAVAITLAGLPVLFDLDTLPPGVRKRLEVRFNTSVVRSEAQQWRFMAANARTWTALGKALAQVSEPGESVVLGAAGATAYPLDGRFVYDRFGLVTPSVARRQAGPRRAHSPGHDKAVDLEFFLDDEPDWLWARIYRGGGVRRAPDDVAELGTAAVRAAYGPRVDRVTVDGVPVLLISLVRSDDPARDWEELPRAIQLAVAIPGMR